MTTPKKLDVTWQDPNALIPWKNNAKIHSVEQVDKIAQQIVSFGFDQPIVVDKQGVIIKGHGRREAALKLGLSEVPTIVTDLDEYQAMAARIADNKVAEAPWNPELLRLDLSALKLQQFDLKLTAIELPQIESILLPMTSENSFGSEAHKNVAERKEDYESSDVRQIILVTDPETFEKLMVDFVHLQEEFKVETNIEVNQRLVELHKAHAQNPN